jgi:hypothetical protein
MSSFDTTGERRGGNKSSRLTGDEQQERTHTSIGMTELGRREGGWW